MSNNPAIVIGVNAVGNANQVLQGVDQKLQQTATTVDSTSNKIVSRTSQMAAAFKQNFTNIAQSIAGLGAGITSFATSFDSIEKAQASATTAQIQYEKSLQRLEKLQASGKATAEQLATAQLEVANNAEKLRLAQDAASDAYVNFLAQVPSQLISFGVAGAGIMRMLGISHGQAAAGAGAQAIATNVLSDSMLRSVGAAIAARAAMIAAFIATPVGAAITGIATLITLLTFNVGGLRDRVFELGNAIMKFLDYHFRPLADAIRWFIDNVAKPFGAFFSTSAPQAIDDSIFSINKLNASTIELGQSMPTALMQVQSAFTSLETVGVASANNILAAYERMKQGVSIPVSVSGNSVNLGAPGSATNFIGLTSINTQSNRSSVNLAPPGSAKNFIGLRAIPNAHGGDYIVNRPTLFLAGEAGIERATFTPMSGSRVGSRGETHIHLHIGSKEIAHAIIGDVDRLLTQRHTRHMRITHEAIHGTG